MRNDSPRTFTTEGPGYWYTDDPIGTWMNADQEVWPSERVYIVDDDYAAVEKRVSAIERGFSPAEREWRMEQNQMSSTEDSMALFMEGILAEIAVSIIYGVDYSAKLDPENIHADNGYDINAHGITVQVKHRPFAQVRLGNHDLLTRTRDRTASNPSQVYFLTHGTGERQEIDVVGWITKEDLLTYGGILAPGVPASWGVEIARLQPPVSFNDMIAKKSEQGKLIGW